MGARGALPIWPPVPAWYDQAACRGMGPELFHPEPVGRGQADRSAIEEAKAVCARCPVRTECLDEALNLSWYHDYSTGAIRGGLTAFERRKKALQKARRARHKAAG